MNFFVLINIKKSFKFQKRLEQEKMEQAAELQRQFKEDLFQQGLILKQNLADEIARLQEEKTLVNK